MSSHTLSNIVCQAEHAVTTEISQSPSYLSQKGSPDCERVDSVNSWRAHEYSKTHHDLTACLPYTLVTSDLGSGHRNFELRFSHILPDEPSIAVFSDSPVCPSPIVWRPERPLHRCRLRYRWHRKNLRIRALCTVRVIVGSKWQHKMSMRSVRHWNSTTRILLLDWKILFEEYFELEENPSNQRRIHDIVKRFQQLEQRTLIMETGAMWTSYGDWNLQQPTAADVALACRYEGRGFEDGVVPLKQRMSAHELSIRLKILGSALTDMMSKHIAKWNWRIERLHNK